jgi:RNA polymerase sigma-70 factor (ECF subfamily)
MENSAPNAYVNSFRNAEEAGINFFFREYYPALCLYADKLIKNKPVAEEIASEAFIKIIKHCNQLDSVVGIKTYCKESMLQVVRQNFQPS